MDAGAFQMGIGGPGIDPRVWMSLAYVNTGAGVNGADVVVDSKEGVFAGVTLLPSQQQDTARLSSEYAANGAGDYVPLIPGEEVLVAVPSGSWDEGLVIVKRLWSPSDPPPAAVVNNSTDASRTLPKDVNQRWVGNEGQFIFSTVGQEQASSQPFVRGSAFWSALFNSPVPLAYPLPSEGGALLDALFNFMCAAATVTQYTVNELNTPAATLATAIQTFTANGPYTNDLVVVP